MARISCIHKTASTTSAAGGPYATIALWEASTNRAANGQEIGVICDDAAYDESVTITDVVSGTDMIRLTSNDGDLVATVDDSPAPDVRPTGPFRDGARIVSTTSSACLTIAVDYVGIDHLSLVQNGTGPACVQISTDRDEIVIAYCAIEVQADIAGSCGVLLDMQSAFQNIMVGGCAFIGHDRAAIMREQAAATGDHTGGKAGADLSLVVSHCAAYSPDADDTIAAFVFVAHNSTDSPGDETGVSIENSVGGWHGPSGGSRVTSFADGTTTSRGAPNGVVVFDGSNNYDDGSGYADIDGTDNLTSWVAGSADPSTVDTTQSTGTYWVVSDLTSPADYRPLDDAAGNGIIGAGLASASLNAGTAAHQSIYDNTRDLRNFTYGTAPDLGPFSYLDHSTIPFITQGQTI